MLGPLLEVLASPRPFAEVLERLLGFITEPSDRPRGCLLEDLGSAPQRLGPETAARVEAITQERREAYAQWFRRAQAQGEVDATLSPVLATHFIDTQLTTALRQMALGTEPDLVRAQAQLAFRALARPVPGPR